MKLWSSQHLFDHTWERVTQALWRKYPNKLNPNVVVVDVIDRRVVEDGTLQTVRILGTTWSFPTFITAMLGIPDLCYAVEYSVVDPVTKTMTLNTVNYTFGSLMEVEESIKYSENQEVTSSTMMTHDALIKVTGISFKDYCEGLIANGFDVNAKKGRQAIEQVIAKISLEGIVQSINEEMDELSKELDAAKAKFDLEIGQMYNRLNTEFLQFVQNLSYEFEHLKITMNTDSILQPSDQFSKTTSLTAAVKNAGFAES
eukprot:gene3636-4152_t